jgi:anti-anti-sigma factor
MADTGLADSPSTGTATRTPQVRTEFVNSWQARISLTGEIDGAAAPAVRAELLRHLSVGRRVLRIDARGVDFVDTTALSVLLEAHWRCLRDGGTLLLTGVRDPLRRLLAITGLDRVLIVDRAEPSGAGGGVPRSPRQRITNLPL